MIDYLIASHES